MSTAEQIFEKAQGLPEPTQSALLKIVEQLVAKARIVQPKPQFGSAKGQISMAPDFDKPLEDFKPYTE